MVRRLNKEGSAVQFDSILAVLELSLSAVPATAVQALKKIRIGISQITCTKSIHYVKDWKFFERDGLDRKMITVKTKAIVAALAARLLGYTTFTGRKEP